MIFLRRTQVFFSTLTLLLAFGGCALAQSRLPEPTQDEAAAKHQQEASDQLKTLAAELRAIREKQAETEQRRTAAEARNGNPFGPSTWSNWVLALFAAIAAVIAAMSLSAIKVQSVETAKAANAAKTSADTGQRALELAMTGILGIKGAFINIGAVILGDDSTADEVGALNVGYSSSTLAGYLSP